MHQAGEHDLLGHPGLERVLGALQEVTSRCEAVLEEIDQGRLRRHLRQARVVAHQHLRTRRAFCSAAPLGKLMSRRRA